VAGLLHGAGERLLASHDLLRQRHLAALDLLLQGEAEAPTPGRGGLRFQLELLIRAQWACDAQVHTSSARRDLEAVVAAFAAVVCALEILDELADGQASDLALALLGESIELVRGVPEPLAPRLLAHWGALWTRCAAARTLDAALATWPDLTVSQAIRVATTSGLVTQWAVEAGAIIADAAPGLMAPLADFGRYLGTAQKLLHDLHALSAGAHHWGDLRRLSGKGALVVARDSGLPPTEPDPGVLDGDLLRRQLVECGTLDYAWACADQCRRRAAAALRLFAGAGGDPTPLAGLLDLPPRLHFVPMDDPQP
jgi:geranylgeranyl pyrophosphate synthase